MIAIVFLVVLTAPSVVRCIAPPMTKIPPKPHKPGCQTCCCGQIYGDSRNSCPDKNFRCCDTVKYDPREDTCCQGMLQEGFSEYKSRCCGSFAYDPDLYTCCGGEVMVPASRNKDQCCGFEAINQKHQICCDGVPYKRNKYQRCCGFDLYDIVKDICCDGVVSTDITATTRCCGPIAFDQCEASCCADGNLAPNPSEVRDFQVQLECGNGIFWSPQSEVCCCGTVVSQPTTATTGCCDTTPYNVETQLCCDGTIISEDPEQFRCCGTSTYTLYEQSCCGGNVISGGLDCCKDQGFDPMTQICCEGSVFSGCPSNTKCCYHDDGAGTRVAAAYNEKKQLCCEGVVRNGNKKYRCCGDEAYLPKKQSCCTGQLVDRRGYRETGDCEV